MTTRTVLVVDDDHAIREVAQLALEIVGGWKVILASSGPEAVSKAGTDRPDAVLLDVMMPGMDGATTLMRLREATATVDIPVIFLTAKAQSGDRRERTDRHVAGLIPKPFDPMTLAAQVAQILEWTT